MNMDLEDQLRVDMERATRDIRVPRGLALKADRHRRKRRTTLRLATAAATATALGGVAIAGVAGAFGSAPTSPNAKLTAYVIGRVQHALAPAKVDGMVGSVRTTYPPGTTIGPVPGGLSGMGGASPWSVGYVVVRADQGTGISKFAGYTSGGRHVFEAELKLANGATTETAVIYRNSTWWTATVPIPPAPPWADCIRGDAVYLRPGPDGGWPGFIRSQLACGAYTVAGHQVIGRLDTIKLTGGPWSTLWVDSASYLPVQVNIGPQHMAFKWLPATPANLAQLNVSVPAGFQRVQPPPPPNPNPGAPAAFSGAR
jgi:hypothetical protein